MTIEIPQSQTEEEETPIEPLFLVNDFWPVYAICEDEDLERVKALDLQFAYLIVNQQIKDDKNVTKTVPAVMKMVNTSFGYAIMKSDLDTIGIKGKAIQTAFLKLPRFSWQVIQRMDRFFRAVFEKHGTEGVVMLTYDMNKLEAEDPSSGWDFYVPKQNNTSTDCNYDIPEVYEHLPEGTILAGTAHSHPEMHAYVSTTDHKDQATFEGIHMTAGWFKGKPTEWFIEATMGGQQWGYDSDVLFETPPMPDIEYTELDGDIEKVTKYVHVQTSFGGHHPYQTSWGAQNGPPKSPAVTANYNSGPVLKGPVIYLPEAAPDPRESTIIIVMNDGENRCRACTAPFTPKTEQHARCYACSTFFVPIGKTWEDINHIRAENKISESAFVDVETAPADIFLWKRASSKIGGLIDDFEQVLEITGGVPKK